MRILSLFFGFLLPHTSFSSDKFSPAQQDFIENFQPLILNVNRSILIERQEVLNDQALLKTVKRLPFAEKSKIRTLGKTYEVDQCSITNWQQSKCINELLARVDILPTHLILAQAINESDWGKSRFAKEGNNYFGIACFSKGCGIIPKKRASGETFEVRRFTDPQASIEGYYNIINTQQPYQVLRDMRFKMLQENKPLDANELAEGLVNYSAQKKSYVKSIREAIAHLQTFPNYKKESS